jgi:endonuclease-3 related protein
VSLLSNKKKKYIFLRIYKTLFKYYGPQHWWPGEIPFEIMIGAILTQNTSWRNVELAINNLKEKDLLTPQGINKMSIQRLRKLIRPAGFFNIKAERIRTFVGYFLKEYKGNIRKMQKEGTSFLREKILAIKGIGPETCDSILLYALEKPVFVVDAYTRRVFSRHNIISEEATYSEIQLVFEKNLKRDANLFNEFHALIVRLAKDKCKAKEYDCESCPLGLLF